jgi:RNA polymerase sigma factor (sigma-70 family)
VAGAESVQLADHLFRREAGKMAAVLTRILGSDRLEVAEDIVQDTLMKAVETWGFKGIPENPSAWLYAVAKNKALDFIRSRKRHEEIHSEIAKAIHSEWSLPSSVNSLFLKPEIEDSQLRMMFAACHPSIQEESQVALTLKILGGLSVREIANAFLTNEETIQKRIARAKEKLRVEKISLEIPSPQSLSSRIDAVLKVLYLLFNEGYHPSQSDQLLREDLCEEAMRLTYLLIQNPLTRQPKVFALMALMCLQVSRFDARKSSEGFISLELQDRSLWNKQLMDKGFLFLEQAAEGNELSEYHLEAVIAAVHMKANSFVDTDWNRLLTLYDILAQLKPGPIIELNRAIAIGYAKSFCEGLEALQKISELSNNHFYHAAMGNFFWLLNERDNALKSYSHSLNLAVVQSDKVFLQKKIDEIKRAALLK